MVARLICLRKVTFHCKGIIAVMHLAIAGIDDLQLTDLILTIAACGTVLRIASADGQIAQGVVLKGLDHIGTLAEGHICNSADLSVGDQCNRDRAFQQTGSLLTGTEAEAIQSTHGIVGQRNGYIALLHCDLVQTICTRDYQGNGLTIGNDHLHLTKG